MMKNVTILIYDEVSRIRNNARKRKSLEGKLEIEDAFGWFLTSKKRIKQYLEEMK